MGKKQDRRIAEHKARAAAQTTKPDPDEIIYFRGWKMSRYTAAAIRFLEEVLGFELTILQGPYNKSVGASAGTHDKDGVIDLAPYRWRKKVKAARFHSWAMWHRVAVAGLWGEHCHGVLKRAKPMAALAVWQLETAYPNHWDGLDGNRHDNFPYHPELERFNYNDWYHDELLDDRIRGLTATINRLVDKLSAARAERKRLRAQKKK